MIEHLIDKISFLITLTNLRRDVNMETRLETKHSENFYVTSAR